MLLGKGKRGVIDMQVHEYLRQPARRRCWEKLLQLLVLVHRGEECRGVTGGGGCCRNQTLSDLLPRCHGIVLLQPISISQVLSRQDLCQSTAILVRRYM